MAEKQKEVPLWERLKEKRLEAGLTQAELAEKVSVTARTIQNYEMGSRKPGNMKVVGDIATVLGTTPEYLLTSADVYSVEAHQKGGAKAARDIDELVGEACLPAANFPRMRLRGQCEPSTMPIGWPRRRTRNLRPKNIASRRSKSILWGLRCEIMMKSIRRVEVGL